MEMRKRKRLLFLILGAVLLVSCATVEAPKQPEAITLGMGTTDGSCGTTLCCSSCPAIPVLSRDSPDQTTFPGYSSRGDTAKYNAAFQGRQMRSDAA